jgi:hypothetical protein
MALCSVPEARAIQELVQAWKEGDAEVERVMCTILYKETGK